MKRLVALLFAALFLCLSLCACMDSTVNKVKEVASEAVSDMTPDATKYSGDNNGLLDDNRETDTAEITEAPAQPTEAEENAMATEWEDMVEDGEIDDGDGNVGERENSDGDGNVDPDAVE